MTSKPDNNSFSTDEVLKQLEAATALPAELIEIFADEASEHLQKIYDGLRRLKDNLSDKEALSEVRRSAHTLKGAAGAIGQQAVTRLSHRMEDLLDELADQGASVSAEQLQLFFDTADNLQQLTSGDFDSNLVAPGIVELYSAYAQQLEFSRANRPSVTEPHDVHVIEVQESIVPSAETPAESRAKSRSKQTCLRVPLSRLDEMAKLLGEMTVNRSQFEHQLQEFESRIADMQNALERLQKISHIAEDISIMDAFGKRTMNDGLEARSSNGRDEFDPLEFEQYSEFHLLSQKLSEADSDAEIVTGEFNKIKQSLDGLLRRQQQLNRNAQNCLMQVRLVPLKTIANQIERTVRTVSKRLGRDVELELIGDEIEVDKTVLDEIADPIQHLIRNAIDHGIEDSAVRQQTGKSATAKLSLHAINHGTQVTLTISDDGAGLNIEKIKQKAVDLGMIDANADLTDEESHALIFRPGFSTAKQLSDVSGRGIGMDVVSDSIRRLKGSIRVDSEAGSGTTFTIQIPTVVGVSRAVFLESAGQQFAIPMQSVKKIERFQPSSVAGDDDAVMTQLSDGDVRLVDLADHLGLRKAPDRNSTFNKTTPMLVLGHGNESVAVTVDTIVGCRDIVVKGLGNHLKNVRGLAGATIAGNGAVVPILDSSDFFDRCESMLPEIEQYQTRHQKKNLAMVIDDSISVRRVTENLLNFAGWDVITATDGVDALAKLAEMESEPDAFLCDLEMPRMDGLEFIRQVREQQEFETTPIVMITSRASEKHRHKAFDAGATEFVVKPYNGEELLEMLSELLTAARETVA